MTKDKNNKTISVHNYHYWLNVLATIIPSVWNLVVSPIYGQTWGLKTVENGQVVNTTIGKIVSWGVFLLSAAFIIIYNIVVEKKGTTIRKSEIDRLTYDTATLKANNRILIEVQNSTNEICNSKYDTLIEEIKQVMDGHPIPSRIISNPTNQLKHIAQSIVSCVSRISNTEVGDLYIRVAYRFQNEKWCWLQGYESKGFFGLNKLENTPNTTFHCITRQDEHREDFIFFNRKSVAVSKSKYVYEPHKDHDGETIDDIGNVTDGSILAKSIFIGKNPKEAFAELAIFIYTTNDILIIDSDEKDKIRNAKNQFTRQIFNVYEKRLEIELALLFLEHLQKTCEIPTNKRKLSSRRVSTPSKTHLKHLLYKKSYLN